MSHETDTDGMPIFQPHLLRLVREYFYTQNGSNVQRESPSEFIRRQIPPVHQENCREEDSLREREEAAVAVGIRIWFGGQWPVVRSQRIRTR